MFIRSILELRWCAGRPCNTCGEADAFHEGEVVRVENLDAQPQSRVKRAVYLRACPEPTRTACDRSGTTTDQKFKLKPQIDLEKLNK